MVIMVLWFLVFLNKKKDFNVLFNILPLEEQYPFLEENFNNIQKIFIIDHDQNIDHQHQHNPLKPYNHFF